MFTQAITDHSQKPILSLQQQPNLAINRFAVLMHTCCLETAHWLWMLFEPAQYMQNNAAASHALATYKQTCLCSLWLYSQPTCCQVNAANHAPCNKSCCNGCKS